MNIFDEIHAVERKEMLSLIDQTGLVLCIAGLSPPTLLRVCRIRGCVVFLSVPI